MAPDFLPRSNAAYVDEQYRRWRQDRASVSTEWAAFFAGLELGAQGAGRPGAGAGGASSGAAALIEAYRAHGHLAARLDPLEDAPPPAPAVLDPTRYGFAANDPGQAIEGAAFPGLADVTLGGLLDALRRTYADTVAVEYAEVLDPERRAWLEEQMEPVRNHPVPDPAERRDLLRQLLLADGFEEFLHVRYPGQKRFSLEGAAALVPMLARVLDTVAADGAQQVVIGMPHRGRLNVLANILHKPLETLFAEFDTHFLPEDVQGHGDVKYHLGFSGTWDARNRQPLELDLNFNPSHLEFVNPVVLGAVRARQERLGDAERTRVVPVLIHGDAALAGEGIVPETLALARLPHYETGGSIHLVLNNQVGFTTPPGAARSLRYATDVARLAEAPVFHVNADDVDAVIHVATVAARYRQRFHADVFVDLVGYRKHGHNELDDPTFTQPVMYRAIAAHPPVSVRYGEALVAAGVLDADGVRALRDGIAAEFRAAYQRVKVTPVLRPAITGPWSGLDWAAEDWDADTRVPRATLERVVQGASTLPAGFRPHRKIPHLLEERRRMFDEDRIDWGLGEALALGTLLLESRDVRLSGQDTERGTFSHRHAVLHDREDDTRYVPLAHLADRQGRLEIFDTPLAEGAPLGFEYGYSTADPETLVAWEAQFGDFVNVAQVYLDQFLASAESKWGRASGLTLLLPHGYEGQGPEHSSARLERFLELCANGNMQVVNLTTPAQFFHALRRQMLRRLRKPLVVMSPKSLLRHKLAVSPVAAFTGDSFHNVIDDASVADPSAARVVLLTSGKCYFSLVEARRAAAVEGVALVRIEQLYPFPSRELRSVLARYPGVRDIRWVQEEPANMGAWRSTRHRLEAILPAGATLRLVARKASPSPATGFYPIHLEQDRNLMERALSTTLPPLGASGAEGPRGAPRSRRHP